MPARRADGEPARGPGGGGRARLPGGDVGRGASVETHLTGGRVDNPPRLCRPLRRVRQDLQTAGSGFSSWALLGTGFWFVCLEFHGPETAGRGLERDPFLRVAGNGVPRSRGQGFEGGAHAPGGDSGAGGGPIQSRKRLARLCRVTRWAVRRTPAVKGPWNSAKQTRIFLPGRKILGFPPRPGPGGPPDGAPGKA